MCFISLSFISIFSFLFCQSQIFISQSWDCVFLIKSRMHHVQAVHHVDHFWSTCVQLGGKLFMCHMSVHPTSVLTGPMSVCPTPSIWDARLSHHWQGGSHIHTHAHTHTLSQLDMRRRHSVWCVPLIILCILCALVDRLLRWSSLTCC